MNCCLVSRCPVWITGTPGVLMENAAAAAAAVWPWEPDAVSPTGMSPAYIYPFLINLHVHKHAWAHVQNTHTLRVNSQPASLWGTQPIVRPWIHTPVWIKLIVRFMGTDCILIVKECLEVTRTWACLTSKTDCREGPFDIKRTSLCWVLPVAAHVFWFFKVSFL